MQPSPQEPMDVFERVLQGMLRDSAHGDRLALALPLLARSTRRSDFTRYLQGSLHSSCFAPSL